VKLDRNMPLYEKAIEMRNAIDGVELAFSGMEDFAKAADLWDGSRDDLEIKVQMRVGDLRQLRRAYDELNRIINSPEYLPANLSE